MIGTSLGHYQILDQLGSGGMGVVFRARDTRLDRDVAVKVLPAGMLADEAARQRFRREALALARLSHPNIGIIHDFASEGGTDYLVMELVGGVPLTERLAGGALPEKEAVALGLQIAAALEDAHEHGVVHRDLKPGNVLVTPKGLVKVLDFGLARLAPAGGAEGETATALTAAHTVMGTLPYMAPEQLRGEAVDGRADIYALGLILYEAAAGRHPFADLSGPRLTDATLRQEPPPPGRLQPSLSADLERLILKCLAKSPDDRYQSAKEVAVDLRRLGQASGPSSGATATPLPPASTPRRAPPWIWAAGAAAIVGAALLLLAFDVGGLGGRLRGGGTSGRIESVAVLPLDNLSRDPAQDYFADGMTEALITELSRIRALKVISRTSAMQYKGTKKSLPEVAHELDVDGIIEGSVAREGDEVRVTVQLIDGATDRHIWAESFQREFRDILNLQGDVAKAIAGQVRAAVTPDEKARMTGRRTVNPEAHDRVLKAGQILRQQGTNREALERGLGLLREAAAIDPESAVVHAALATIQSTVAGVGYRPMREACPEFRRSAERAIELDPGAGEGYSARALTRFYCDWDWDGALSDGRRGIELMPGSGLTHDQQAWMLSFLGRHDEAMAELDIAAAADPMSLFVRGHRVQVQYNARRYDLSLTEAERGLASFPDSIFIQWEQARTLAAMGRYDEAVQTFLRRKVPTAGTNWALGFTYGRMGRVDDARKVLEFLLQREKSQFIWPVAIGVVYIGLGDRDRAFERLDRAYAEREYWMHALNVDPMFDPLRADPRFQDLLKRMNFPAP